MKRTLLLVLTALLILLAQIALADAPELSFSLKSGFYDGPQQLKITCDNRKAVIYYTLDGPRPVRMICVTRAPSPWTGVPNGRMC